MKKQLILSFALIGGASTFAMEDAPADLNKPEQVQVLLQSLMTFALKHEINNATTTQALDTTTATLSQVQHLLPQGGYTGNVPQQLTRLIEQKKHNLTNPKAKPSSGIKRKLFEE